MPQPAELDTLVEQLTRLYQTVVDDLTRQAVDAALDPNGSRRLRRLRELQAAVDDAMTHLADDTAAWINEAFPRIYVLGGDQGAGPLGQTFTWTQPHVDAVRALAQDLFDDVLEATRHVGQATKTWLRTEARRQTALSLLEGRTATQAGRELAKTARAQGLLSVTYENGARHALDSYADMLLRTKTAQAFNAGTLNYLGGAGVGFVEVLDGASCGWAGHTDPDSANGSIRSLEDAADRPLSHPNCRRSFIGRPDVTDQAGAKQAKSLRSDEQIADQAQAEVETAARRAASRPAREARTPRQPRTPRADAPPTVAPATTGSRFTAPPAS